MVADMIAIYAPKRSTLAVTLKDLNIKLFTDGADFIGATQPSNSFFPCDRTHSSNRHESQGT
jgi:hypothetical protein